MSFATVLKRRKKREIQKVLVSGPNSIQIPDGLSLIRSKTTAASLNAKAIQTAKNKLKMREITPSGTQPHRKSSPVPNIPASAAKNSKILSQVREASISALNKAKQHEKSTSPKSASPNNATQPKKPSSAPKSASPNNATQPKKPTSAPKTTSPNNATHPKKPTSAPKTTSPNNATQPKKPSSAPKSASPNNATQPKKPTSAPKTTSPNNATHPKKPTSAPKIAGSNSATPKKPTNVPNYVDPNRLKPSMPPGGNPPSKAVIKPPSNLIGRTVTLLRQAINLKVQKSQNSAKTPKDKKNNNFRAKEKARGIAEVNQSSSKYKYTSRRVTMAIVALPIALVTSWVLYQRLILGEKRKELVPPGISRVEEEQASK